MRCQICDYSEGGPPSVYNESLIDSRVHRRVRYNSETGVTICDHCHTEAKVEWEDEEETDELST